MTSPRTCDECGDLYDAATGDTYSGLCATCVATLVDPDNELDELRAENQRLRSILTKIAHSRGEDWDCWWIAEQALNTPDHDTTPSAS